MTTVPRTWVRLPTLDLYILREFLFKFFLLLLVLAIMFILSDVFNDLSDFLEEGAPIGTIISYFLLRLPGNISFVLPISVLLSCMWTMALFGKNLEVTAMRASGLSLMRCGRSIFFMGLLASVFNIYLNEIIVPEYNLRASRMLTHVKDGPDELDDYQRMLTFTSADKKRVWLFQTFDDEGAHKSVSVKFLREDGTRERHVNAESAFYDRDIGWKFLGVTLSEYSRDGSIRKKMTKYEELVFPPGTIRETPEFIKNTVTDVDLLPCWTILSVLRNSTTMSPKASDIYWTVFFYRLAFPWASFIAVFIGVPLATKNERSGIMLAVISAVVVIVAYIILSETFKVLGRQGVINPFAAGTLPTMAFIVYGYWNVRRDRV